MGHGARTPMVERVLRRYEPGAGPVLEFGCGSAPYRSLFGSRYMGLDLAQSVYAEGTTLDVIGDAAAMPLPDGLFGMVFCVATLYLIEDAAEALREARRVAADGAPVIVFDYRRKTLRRLDRSGGSPAAFWSQRDLVALMRECGLRDPVLPLLEERRGGSSLGWLLRTALGAVAYQALAEWRGGWNVVVAFK